MVVESFLVFVVCKFNDCVEINVIVGVNILIYNDCLFVVFYEDFIV